MTKLEYMRSIGIKVGKYVSWLDEDADEEFKINADKVASIIGNKEIRVVERGINDEWSEEK